jgi:tetratricopeptide (TPR) repeat protein
MFVQTAGFEFINLDDGDYVFGNPNVAGGISWNGICWAFTKVHMENWHPLTWISLMLDCNLYGLNPAGFHLTNVVLHAATAVSLFLVLRAMTGRLWPSALAAALFAVHPLRVESVAWVTERKDVLSGFCCMLMLGAYVYYARRPFSLVRYSVVLLLLALGLLSKAILVTVPFLLLVLDYWPLGRWAATKESERGRRGEGEMSGRRSAAESPPLPLSPSPPLGRLLAEKIPMLLLAVLAIGLTVWAQQSAIKAAQPYGIGWRVRYIPIAYVVYLAQLVWPAGLAGLYPRPFEVPLWQTFGAVAMLAVITAAAVIGRRRYPYLLVGWLWFLGMSVPVIGIVQLGTAAVADRNTYLTQVGLAIAIAWGAADACRKKGTGILCAQHPEGHSGKGRRSPFSPESGDQERGRGGDQRIAVGRGGSPPPPLPVSPFPAFAAVLALALLLAAAWRQTWFWHDSQTFWNRALACTSNNAVAHTNLGVFFGVTRHPAEAAAQLHKALKIDPKSLEALFSLGSAYFELGQLDQAATYYRRAIEVDPTFAQAPKSLARVLAGEGKWDAAVAQYEQALKLTPDDVPTRFSLAAVELNRGDLGAAARQWKAILRIQPDSADALLDLAEVLAIAPDPRVRDGASAIGFAQRADRLTGGKSPEVLRVLAAAEAETGQFRQAAATARWALELAIQQRKEPLAANLKGDVARFEIGLPRRGPW